MESGLNAAALDWLKIGRLVLHDRGWEVLRDTVWEGAEAVLPARLLREATSPPSSPDPPGFTSPASILTRNSSIYMACCGRVSRACGGQPDCFAQGLFGQVLYVAREQGMVLLRTGLDEGDVPFSPALLRDLAAGLCPAGQDAIGN